MDERRRPVGADGTRAGLSDGEDLGRELGRGLCGRSPMLTLRVQWGYDTDVVRFFGPVGRSNVQDLAKDLNRDLVQERFEEYQVCGQSLLLRPTASHTLLNAS